MAYQAGDLIEAEHFNVFAQGSADGTNDRSAVCLRNLWNNGSVGYEIEDAGYQQGDVLQPVVAGEAVAATQWATLINRMNTMAAHQDTTLSAITAPTAGDLITAYSQLANNMAALHANRLNAVGVGTTQSHTQERTASWNNSVTMDFRVFFDDDAALRAFFNCGGHIKITASRTGGSASDKNTSWSSLCTALGTCVLTAGTDANQVSIAGTDYYGFDRVGGSGAETILNNDGVYQLTDSYFEKLRLYAGTYLYTQNYINVSMKRPTGLTTTELNIRVKFQDDANANVDEIVDGTLSTTLTLVQPSTSYLTDSWGAQSITAVQY